MITVIFTKKFISGNLKGLQVSGQKLEFETEQDMKNWVWHSGAGTDAVVKTNKDVLTGDKYTIPFFHLQRA